ncbi:MAG: hypothetical protein HC883_02455 [Bdellovibrionaceae bacterium]|nr:hypothetical protein [Pseudobdellovibrionaceae bacterium]
MKQNHRIQRTSALLSTAAQFNAVDYLALNPDVASAGIDPRAHYASWGEKELRNPNALFDEQFYVAVNTDVNKARLAGSIRSGLEHFRLYGLAEGRQIYTRFDEATYLAQNPDVAVAVLMYGNISSGLEHYALYGRAEGRKLHISQSRSAY